jgi:hypothetical protein
MKWLFRPVTVVVVAILFFAAVAMFPTIYYGYSVEDSMACLTTIGDRQTAYPEKYSERKFARIRVGMTPDQVTALVGPPLEQSEWEISTNIAAWWRYSRPASKSGHYHYRALQFSTQGAVVKVHRSFYFD